MHSVAQWTANPAPACPFNTDATFNNFAAAFLAF